MCIRDRYENPATQSIYVYPLAQQWEGGVGKFGDELGASLTSQSADKSGCSWRYRKAEETDAWTLSSFPTDVTGSYNATYPGGGSWFSASNGTSLEATQSFGLNDQLDLSVDITTAAKLHYSGTLNNYGYIVKLQDNLEFNYPEIAGTLVVKDNKISESRLRESYERIIKVKSSLGLL